ncbi:MAG: aldehyde ferredoxin oxidoreductase [Alphaproteobacteria bacterium]|nr:aldehyde ferredoxin oxidoreductase [Alphaproteobacteria bacterium]
MLLDQNIATVDPMAPENPLIFSVGPFAGTNFSNANRLSVGCKSPLTGGIKEANSGGTFGFAMGQLLIAGISFHGASDSWVVIRITKDGVISFDDAAPYMGLGNFDSARKLHEAYGEKTSLALCGPVGEYLGLMAGVAFSDTDNRPSRLAARGGVGAVMGAKKIKAVVIDKDRMPPVNDRKKLMGAIKDYGKKLGESVAVQSLKTTGTAMVADLTNHLGALPVRNFSSGQGCLIKCSNVYVDDTGRELVSPLEYETIGLLGTNCGLDDPDDVARLNETANDLGVDSIELGATIGVLMEAGEGAFGDVAFMQSCLEDIRVGNERGRLYASGTARVGKALKVARVPVIKQQAISAYDPRIIEVTGISMMLTAQGADHTVGNAPSFKCDDKTIEELVAESLRMQINSAVADSFGLCVFGRSVTDDNLTLIADAINDSFDAGVTPDFIRNIGFETLRLEAAFNKAAGFDQDDDELPSFFRDEPLPPTGKMARLYSREVNIAMQNLMDAHSH